MQPFLAMVFPVQGGLGDRPGHELPGAPVYPSHGLPGAPGIDNTLPAPPPGYPSHGLPGGGPVDPGYGRPGGGWSPVDPGYGQGGGFRPDQSLPGMGGRPSQPIFIPDPPDAATKPPPPSIWPPLPGGMRPSGVLLVWLIGVGYRWVHIAEHPDQELPPTAEPKS